jgi:nucleotide-binding universal stress UspA family protein
LPLETTWDRTPELQKISTESKQEVRVPMMEILRIEKEGDISLIVIGSHGMTNLQEMFLGSVSEKFIRKFKKPILVIKRELS